MRQALILPEFLAIKVQPNDWQQSQAVEGASDPKGDIVPVVNAERYSVEGDGECEN